MDGPDRAREMGYFRFSVINPLLAHDLTRSLKDRVDDLASRVYTLPNGAQRQFSRATIEDWLYDYRAHGLPALIHPPRKDRGMIRAMPESVIDAIGTILKAHPSIKSSNLIRLLDEQQLRPDGTPSDSTIYRYLRPIRKAQKAEGKTRRAFEAPYAGALYQTDIMYGPHVRVMNAKGRYENRATYLIGIIDDHSRLLCHGQFFTTQELMAYIQVLEQAVSKRGIPEAIYCDNGKVFLSAQVKRIGAEIGMRVVHTAVRDAAAKGKIERFFLTVRNQFLDLTWRTESKHDLATLNHLFFAWYESYNTREHRALDMSPMQKWLASPRHPRRLAELPDTTQIFLLETTRRVKKDGTFSLHAQRYETLSVAVGASITIRYHRFDLTRVHVYLDSQYLGIAHPLDPGSNHQTPRD